MWPKFKPNLDEMFEQVNSVGSKATHRNAGEFVAVKFVIHNRLSICVNGIMFVSKNDRDHGEEGQSHHFNRDHLWFMPSLGTYFRSGHFIYQRKIVYYSFQNRQACVLHNVY